MWWLELSAGVLVGLCISNGEIRHLVLLLLMWSFKSLRFIFNGFVVVLERLITPAQKKVMPKPQEDDEVILGTDMTEQDILRYIRKYPERITAKPKGGE